jgi:hypothetical protein
MAQLKQRSGTVENEKEVINKWLSVLPSGIMVQVRHTKGLKGM